MVSDEDRAHALQIGFHLGPKAIDSAALFNAVALASGRESRLEACQYSHSSDRITQKSLVTRRFNGPFGVGRDLRVTAACRRDRQSNYVRPPNVARSLTAFPNVQDGSPTSALNRRAMQDWGHAH